MRPQTSSTPRASGRRGSNTQSARSVVRQAIRRERGYTTTNFSTHIPAYRETKQINLVARFTVIYNENDLRNQITRAGLATVIGVTNADVKIRRATLFVPPVGTTEPVQRDLFVYSGSELKELQRLLVSGDRANWVSGTIYPPQDDWIRLGSGTIGDDVVIESGVGGGTGESPTGLIHLDLTYRVLIPPTTCNASSDRGFTTPQSSFQPRAIEESRVD